jgi:hypothetical protein
MRKIAKTTTDGNVIVVLGLLPRLPESWKRSQNKPFRRRHPCLKTVLFLRGWRNLCRTKGVCELWVDDVFVEMIPFGEVLSCVLMEEFVGECETIAGRPRLVPASKDGNLP